MLTSKSAQWLGNSLKKNDRIYYWLYCYNFFFLFRYSVKVTAPHIATVQVQTSKSDVFIKLQVLDNEEEIVSVTGMGHAVIPAFKFLSNEMLLSSHCKYCIICLLIFFQRDTCS